MAARLLIAVLAATLLVPAAPANATDEGAPFVAPGVVEQGEFALHLAGALGIALVHEGDAAEAMNALAVLGVAPPEGWEGDMPVTPQTVAELRRAVANAAAAGRLPLEPAVALAAFARLVAELGLPLPYEPPPAYAGQPPGHANGYCDRATLEHYYGAVGPPYYTYCPPPPSYYYLYAWVPSRFYWGGHFFSGFFVIRDVHVHVVPRFKHRPRHPRFSDGVLEHRRPIPPHSAPDRHKGFRDRHAGHRPPHKALVQPRAPRAIPRAPERPRFSDGLLGGRRDVPAAVARPRPPIAASRPAAPLRSAPRASPPRAATAPPRAGAARPSIAPAGQGAMRGWRDVVPGRR